jgi:alpha-glucosidase
MWVAAPPSTAGYHPTEVELHLFVPDADGTFISALQEDDGASFAAATGAHVRTTFGVVRSGQQVTLRAEVGGNGYPEFARRQFDLIIHGPVSDTVLVDGSRREIDGGRITLPNEGSAFTVEFLIG